MTAVDAVVKVVFSWSEVGEEVCPVKVGIVVTGGAVIEFWVHLLSGDSYVGDGALAEFTLQGKPKNKTKATVILVAQRCHCLSCQCCVV